MKKRNKKYIPKPVFAFGGLAAFEHIAQRSADNNPIPSNHATDCAAAYWISFHQLTNGIANEENWSTVVCSLNIGLILCEKGIGDEFEGIFNLALDGMVRARTRGQASGNYRLDGDAITSVTECLHVHDQQMRLATKSEIVSSLENVKNRINSGDFI